MTDSDSGAPVATVPVTKLVGVVGAGTIGRGVAQAFAEAGYPVRLADIAVEALAQARAEIAESVRMAPLLRPRSRGLDPAEVTGRIEFTTDLEDLADVAYVIENITESWAAKARLYPRLDDICPAECIFGVNTSAIPVTRIASRTRRAERVLGTHFMNPVPLKKTVEVIRGQDTSDATLELMLGLLASIGKDSIVINDSPGFVSNRVMMVTVNEAAALVQEGVATAADVDGIFKRCYAHKMGPLETADLIGLDTIVLTLEVLYESFGDSKFKPCALLQDLVGAGFLGRKAGRGFHNYGSEETPMKGLCDHA